MNLNIRQCKSDVIFLQNFRNEFLDTDLDIGLTVGQHLINGRAAHNCSDLRLNKIFQYCFRHFRIIKILNGIGYLIFNEEIHINYIVVTRDHLGFLLHGIIDG